MPLVAKLLRLGNARGGAEMPEAGPSLTDRVLETFARSASAFMQWHKWPFLIAVATLVGLRTIMRWSNLYDTETAPPKPVSTGDMLTQRTADGAFNGLDLPWMGRAGAR